MSNLMMIRSLILFLVLIAPALARGADPPPSLRAYDVLRSAYGAYVDPNDPLAFPAKVRSLSIDRYNFWRGAKDIFFVWCKNNTQKWLADKDAYVRQEGDQHLGNVGTYMTGRNFGTLAFGMVDFDDSHNLPFQFELLQGIITLRLAAEANQVSLDDDQLDQLISSVLEHYENAANSTATATDLLADDPMIVHMKIRLGKKNYGKELNEYTDGNKLRPFAPIRKAKDVFRPAMDKTDPIATGIAQAIARSPQMVRIFNYHTAAEIRANIKDLAQRTRLGSAGSQGLKKYFVLLRKPLAGVDHDAIIYVKQQVPTAAERAGIIPLDPRSPGQRCAEDLELLSHPAPFLNGWFQMGNQSYWVTLREPWTDELESDDIKDLAGLRHIAKLWATAAGASHRGVGEGEMIRKRIGPELSNELRQLSNAYLLKLSADYEDFKTDPRTPPLITIANHALDSIKSSIPSILPDKRKDD
jgi:uncharacterized protein (DUF2252 family)